MVSPWLTNEDLAHSKDEVQKNIMPLLHKLLYNVTIFWCFFIQFSFYMVKLHHIIASIMLLHKLMYYVTRDINLAHRFKANAWLKKNLEPVASSIRSSPRIGPSNILGLRAEPKPDSCQGSFLAHNEFTLKKRKKNAPGSNYCCFLYVASCVFIKKKWADSTQLDKSRA